MDKQTLSNYGWLVVVTLVLAIMLALATPFGSYVGDGVVSVANGFVGTSNDATAEENISQEEVEWAVKTDHGIDYNTFKYYSNLEDAIEAVNNNNYNNASSKLKNNSVVVGVSRDGKTPVVRLVEDIQLKEETTIISDIILDLSNKTLKLPVTNNSGFIIKSNYFECSSNTKGTIFNDTAADIFSFRCNNSTVKFKNIEMIYDAECKLREEDMNDTIIANGGYVGFVLKGSLFRTTGKNITFFAENCKFEARRNSTHMVYIFKTSSANFINCEFINNGDTEQVYGLSIAKCKNVNINKCTFLTKTSYNQRIPSDAFDNDKPCNIWLRNSYDVQINNCKMDIIISCP